MAIENQNLVSHIESSPLLDILNNGILKIESVDDLVEEFETYPKLVQIDPNTKEGFVDDDQLHPILKKVPSSIINLSESLLKIGDKELNGNLVYMGSALDLGSKSNLSGAQTFILEIATNSEKSIELQDSGINVPPHIILNVFRGNYDLEIIERSQNINNAVLNLIDPEAQKVVPSVAIMKLNQINARPNMMKLLTKFMKNPLGFGSRLSSVMERAYGDKFKFDKRQHIVTYSENDKSGIPILSYNVMNSGVESQMNKFMEEQKFKHAANPNELLISILVSQGNDPEQILSIMGGR